MSPNSLDQIERGRFIVARDWAYEPGVARAYVRESATEAAERLRNVGDSADLAVVIPMVLAALEGAVALIELEAGERGGYSATAYQPELAARVATAMGGAS